MPDKKATSGNPYARISAPVGIDEVSTRKSWNIPDQLGLPLDLTPREEASPAAPTNEELHKNHNHPYAVADAEASTGSVKIRVPQKLAKKDFQARCRDLFMQYIPPEEGKALRSHYRAFINRNENRSPEARSAILQELLRFDYSEAGNISPYFNREDDPFTDAKLQAIEEKLSDLD